MSKTDNSVYWSEFQKEAKLTDQQRAQFELYTELLLSENEKINLTALTEERVVIKRHYLDSLILTKAIDLSDREKVKALADVGCGAGFPSIPLKIMFPDLPLLLIETNGKRQAFLELVIEKLGLTDCEIYPNDWRTFLRTTEGDVNCFVARASLSVMELSRVFKPASDYNESPLFYWASETWEPTKLEAPFVQNELEYRIGSRKRKLITLKKPSS